MYDTFEFEPFYSILPTLPEAEEIEKRSVEIPMKYSSHFAEKS